MSYADLEDDDDPDQALLNWVGGGCVWMGVALGACMGQRVIMHGAMPV